MSAHGTSKRPTLCDRYCNQTGLTTGSQQPRLLREDLIVAGERPRLAAGLYGRRCRLSGRTRSHGRRRRRGSRRAPRASARARRRAASRPGAVATDCGAAHRWRRSRRASSAPAIRCGAATFRNSSRGRRRRRRWTRSRRARSRGRALRWRRRPAGPRNWRRARGRHHARIAGARRQRRRCRRAPPPRRR